jgi:hypothetical protein
VSLLTSIGFGVRALLMFNLIARPRRWLLIYFGQSMLDLTKFAFGSRAYLKCDFAANKIFESEVVELISLEGEEVNDGLRIAGELSNYEFTIICKGLQAEPS